MAPAALCLLCRLPLRHSRSAHCSFCALRLPGNLKRNGRAGQSGSIAPQAPLAADCRPCRSSNNGNAAPQRPSSVPLRSAPLRFGQQLRFAPLLPLRTATRHSAALRPVIAPPSSMAFKCTGARCFCLACAPAFAPLLFNASLFLRASLARRAGQCSSTGYAVAGGSLLIQYRRFSGTLPAQSRFLPGSLPGVQKARLRYPAASPTFACVPTIFMQATITQRTTIIRTHTTSTISNNNTLPWLLPWLLPYPYNIP